ncbi:MAG TPA: glycosyltransferase family 4 protein [Planctomycetota bacterium]|nr:glycosyltransferase family 4 protein [Planctomycetota bacterium]
MKIAYLTNQYPKTSHTFIRREIAGVEAAGIEVERISVRATEEQLVDPRDREERARTRVILAHGALGLLPSVFATFLRQPLRAFSTLLTALAMGRGSQRGSLRHLAYFAEACVLVRWMKAGAIDHVHVHFATNPATVALLCRDLGGPPFSFTTHGSADFRVTTHIGLRKKIDRARFVVAVCEDGKKRLLACTPAGQEGKLYVVCCGVDDAFLAATPTAVPQAARFVCIARLSSEKGIAVLLRAARMLADEGYAFELALVGDGPERAALEALASRLRLTAHVRFEGWKSGAEVRDYVLASRALVLPSLSEGLPVVIMEALALRRPVICTTVGGVAELVKDGLCGWLVSPGSETELARAMRAALRSTPEQLEAMGRNGAERVAERHDAGTRARELTQLFLDSRADSWTGARSSAHAEPVACGTEIFGK